MAVSWDSFPKLLTIFVLILPTCDGQSPIVDTLAGRVRGSVVSGVSLFSAIPYGAPPTGNLRFDVPRKAQPWQGVFDATQRGYGCIQFFRFPGRPVSLPESEDCLSLDVYVPQDLSSRRPHPPTPRPVLVVVPDGGYVFGSRGDVNATRMAKREDIIVVVMNYRLGALGFMALDDEDIPGNIALYDIRLALQWVQENIAAFGGNPKKVVAYGKSAGSFAVSMQLLSPLSKGLFSGAILSSGMYSETLTYRAQAAKSPTQIAASLGCDTSSAKDVLSCLRNLDVQTLKEAYYRGPGRHLVFIDGKFVVEHPADALECGRFNHVPIMAGFNSDNGHINLDVLSRDLLRNGLLQNRIDEFIRLSFNFASPGLTEELRQIAGNLTRAFYFNGDTSDRWVNIRAFLDTTRDMYWSAPVVKYGKYFSKFGGPAYLFEFDERRLSNQGNPPPIPVGAYHTDDQQFVWGDIEDARRFPADATPEKIQFSKDLMAAWGSFVRTGKPSLKNIQGQQLDWKAYTEDNPSYAHLEANVTTIEQDPAHKADLVWNKIMSAVEDRKPVCSEPEGSLRSGQQSWFWMFNWNPRGSWWGWWMS